MGDCVDRFRHYIESNGVLIFYPHGCGYISADDDELMELMAEASELFADESEDGG